MSTTTSELLNQALQAIKELEEGLEAEMQEPDWQPWAYGELKVLLRACSTFKHTLIDKRKNLEIT